MRSIFLFAAVVLLGYFGQAQQSSTSNVSLSKKYAAKVLEDYRENSKSKVEDLFAYFQILTDASLTDALKNEVVKNIKNSFQNQNPEVIDFTSETNDQIKLYSLIDKLLLSEPIVFKVSHAGQINSETALSWKTNYTVTRVKSGVSQNIKVSQLVYLFEQNKVFGTSSKNVTVSFLGKIIINQ